MKVFVFKPSNENIGNFTIDTLEDLHSAFRAFSEARDVTPDDYLECSGRSWTVMQGEGGLKLADGRHPPVKQRPYTDPSKNVASAGAVPASRYPALQTLSAIYRIFAYVVGAVALLAVVLGIVKFDSGGLVLIIWGLVGGFLGVITNLAIAEGMKVFIAIEENTRSTCLLISNKNSADSPC